MSRLLLKLKNSLKILFNGLKQTCSDDKKELKCSLAEGTGFALPFLRWFFERILYKKLSLHYWLIARRYEKKKREKQDNTRWEDLWKRQYRCVDWYVISWLALGIVFFLLLFIHGLNQQCVVRWIFTIFLSYRLLDIFQAWVKMFLLSEDPELRDPLRTLVLVLIGYFEIAVAYAVIAFLYKNGFQEVLNTGTFDHIVESLRYSVGVLTTLGSTWEPSACNGYLILYTQVLLGVLFIIVVIQRVIALIHERKS